MSVWQRIIVDGSNNVVRAFVAGALAAHDAGAAAVYWGEDVGLDRGSLPTRLAALFTGDHHHELFLPEALAAALRTVARENDRSLSAEARLALKAWLARTSEQAA